MLGNKEGEYAYAYGVISGKAVKLLRERDLEDLAQFRNVEEILAYLEGTDYEEDIRNVVKKKIDIGEVENALMKHFLRLYEEITSTIPTKEKTAVDRTVREDLVVRNLKIILRGIHSGMDREELRRLVGPGLESELRSELLEAENIEDVVERLKETPYYSPLEEILPQYNEEEEILPLENTLDRELVKRWKEEELSEEMETFIGVRSDVLNIRTLVKCKLMDIPCKGYIIAEGYQLENVEELAVMNLEEMLEELDKTHYGEAVRQGYEKYKETKSLTRMDLLLDEMVIDQLKQSQIFKPLGINSILLFLLQKEQEVRNLRTIIVCRSHGIQSKEVMKLLT